jgi:hypothetical protein
MTKETIIENCHRLLCFMKTKQVNLTVKDDELNSMGLLRWYERCLDVNGCHNAGTSILFIKDKDEFKELKNYASLNFDNYLERHISDVKKALKKKLPDMDFEVFDIPKFTFDWNGYHWEVENR